MDTNLRLKIAIALAIIMSALIGCAFLKVYYVADHGGATVFWKGEQAYVFAGSGSTGYRFSYLRYPLVVLGEYFNAPPVPAAEKGAGTVIRVTPSAVERYQADFGKEAWSAPQFLTPFDDGFYAMCAGSTLCKWMGDRFEPATEEERRRLDGTNRLFHGDTNNQVINGWSVREVRRSPGDHFDVEIGNKFKIHAENHAKDVRAYPWISVELLRPGKVSENLYNVDGAPRRVSRAEYEKLFGAS
jgi:hypothetical protein